MRIFQLHPGIYSYSSTEKAESCIHRFENHTLMCVYSGELEIICAGRQISLRRGSCVFITASQVAQIKAHAFTEERLHFVALTLSRSFIREFYLTVRSHDCENAETISVCQLPESPDLSSLFQSFIPYMAASENMPSQLCQLKMAEGILALLGIDGHFYQTLFSQELKGKLDLLDIVSRPVYDIMRWKSAEGYVPEATCAMSFATKQFDLAGKARSVFDE